MWKDCNNGNTAPVQAFIEKSKSRAQALRAEHGRRTVGGDEEEGSEEEESEEEDEEGEGGEAADQSFASASSHRSRRNEPDEDGWVTIPAARGGQRAPIVIPENAVSADMEEVREGVAGLDTKGEGEM